MGKVLIIAEKPSVAKEIAHAVGATKRVAQESDARYGYFDGNTYIVSWCFGHLVQPCYPEDYNEEYKSWRAEDLPIIPTTWKYSTSGSGSKQYQVLKKLLNSSEVDSVICATDADREGELIFRLVYNQAKSRKPVQRLWISSMEESAIKDGMKKLRPSFEYDALYHAADARQKADWIVGLNATRYYTVKCLNGRGTLTVGRVQTPTVNLIVKRQEEIDNFKPQPYYILTADTGSFVAALREEDHNVAISKVRKCNGQTGVITSIKQEKKKVNPPELYDLTHLQQDADKHFGYSATQTLSIVQGLYEKKLLTYPRTDSQYITSDMYDTAASVVNGLLKMNVGGDIVMKAFNGQSPLIKQIVNDKKVSGHHAIIPTQTAIKTDISGLAKQEKNVFNLVAIRLLAAVCVPHEYLSTRIVLTIENEDFKATGKQVLIVGWRDVAACLNVSESLEKGKGNSQEFDNEQTLPVLHEGESFNNVTVSSEEKFTQPPSLYTEATLLKEMQNIGRRIEDEELKNVMTQVDDNGNKKMLGTAATQGAIIDKIIKNGYVVKKGRKLSPTPAAYSLMSVLPEVLKSPETTAEWEKRLEEIKGGKYDEETFLNEISDLIKKVISSFDNSTVKISSAAFNSGSGTSSGKTKSNNEGKSTVNSIGKCPVCGCDVVLNKFDNYSCTGYKSGCKFTVYRNIAGKKLTDTQVKKLLSDKKTGLIKGFIGKSGKAFDAYLKLNSAHKVEFEFKKR